jgi:hypothetical protein
MIEDRTPESRVAHQCRIKVSKEEYELFYELQRRLDLSSNVTLFKFIVFLYELGYIDLPKSLYAKQRTLKDSPRLGTKKDKLYHLQGVHQEDLDVLERAYPGTTLSVKVRAVMHAAVKLLG